jgi:hypothetical protein
MLSLDDEQIQDVVSQRIAGWFPTHHEQLAVVDADPIQQYQFADESRRQTQCGRPGMQSRPPGPVVVRDQVELVSQQFRHAPLTTPKDIEESAVSAVLDVRRISNLAV